MAAQEGRGWGNRVFFSRTGKMWAKVRVPVAEEKLIIHRDWGGRKCVPGWGLGWGGSPNSNQIHFLPYSIMVTDVHNDGPGALQVPKVPFKSLWKSQFCLGEFLSYLKFIPIKQSFVKLLRTTVWETLHFIVFWDPKIWLSIFNIFSDCMVRLKGPEI